MKMHLYEHIGELRKRLIIISISLLGFFIIGFFASNFFIERIIKDLIWIENVKIVGLTPLEYILTQLKVGLIISFIITLPLIIYQVLAFIRPGLNKKERSAIRFILPSFILLALAGIAFTYFIFLPVGIYFLASLSKGIIENIWSIYKFVNFVLMSCLGFALIFQLPLFILVLNRLGLVNPRVMRKYRAHIYVLIFVIAAIITPPDAITQIIIAIPFIVLYEITLLIIR